MRPDHEPLPPPGDVPAKPPDPRGLFEVFSVVDDGELRLPVGSDGAGLLVAELFVAFAALGFLLVAWPGQPGDSNHDIIFLTAVSFLLVGLGVAAFEFFATGAGEVVFDRKARTVCGPATRCEPNFQLLHVRDSQPWPTVRARYAGRSPREALLRHQLLLEWGDTTTPTQLLAIDCLRQPSRPEEAWAAIRSYMAGGTEVTLHCRLRLPMQAPIWQAAWRQLQVLLPTEYGRDYRAAAAYSARQPGSGARQFGVILAGVAATKAFFVWDETVRQDWLANDVGWLVHAAFLVTVTAASAALLAALWLGVAMLHKVNGHAVRHLRWRFPKPPLRP